MHAPLKPLTWNGEFAPRSAEIRWLWPGLLAEGNLTLLTGGWKSGKTTLIALLLDRRNAFPSRDGRPARREANTCPLLLNRGVRPGATVVVSEEDESLWLRRQQRLDFGANVGFWCRPFVGRPTPDHWHALLDQLLDLRKTRDIDLVIIDPLAMFLPANENHSASLLAPLTDLQRLTATGLSVLLLHHPSKKETRPGHAARGTGALSAYADILLELGIPAGDPATRRRRLLGFSRFEETPHRLLLELSLEGADYAVKADSIDDESFRLAAGLIVALLRQFPTPLTRPEILAAWPKNVQPPTPPTLWRWLTRLTNLGLVEQTGKGTRNDGFRYGAARVKENSD